MITIEKQTDSTGILTDTFAAPDVLQLDGPRDTSTRHSELSPRSTVKTISSQSLTAWVHNLARDAKNPNITTFPFALGICLTLMTGSIALGWGLLLDSVWLAATGFLIALAGCSLYGVSQRDD